MARRLGGEVGWWCPSLDDAGNGTTVLDDLIGSNNGTLTNMDPATDWVADTVNGGVRALDFDGVNDFVNCGNSSLLNPVTAISVSAWIRPGSSANTYMWVIGRDDLSSGRSFAFGPRYAADGKLWLQINGISKLIGASVIAKNTWTHVAFTGSSVAGYKIYVNGVLDGTAAWTAPNVTTGSTTIGARTYAGSQGYFLGSIDDIRLCNRELTQTEITALASQRGYQPPPVTGLGGEVAWWCPSLDTIGNGTTLLRDLTGAGNNGTLTNMDAASDWVADTANGGVRALDFDGVNDLIELGSMGGDLTENIPFSVSMWALARATGQNKGLMSRDQSGSPYAFAIRFNGGANITLLTDDVSFKGPTISANVWFHLAVILAPSLRQFHLNGILTNETTAAYTVTANTDVLRIGCDYNPAADRCWNGLIDDCRIFNRALTAFEIAALASQRGYQLTTGSRRRRQPRGFGL